MPTDRKIAARAAVCLLLCASAFVALAPVLDAGFVNYDDPRYVTQNPVVRDGLTLEGIRWSLTATDAANWHPLTWLSHMLDYTLFGLDPRGHHLTSLLLHAANAAMLFLLLDRMTGALVRSAFVAAFFAVHPLHVESVAWIAERKDVLSTFFGFLALTAYVRYARKPEWGSSVAVSVCFALSLAAKPMLVTLPFLMLLLDFWPLGRMAAAVKGPGRPAPLAGLLREKIPWLALSAASCAVTLVAQRRAHAVQSLADSSLAVRAANAVASCGAYVAKTLWPSDLSVLYPHPGSFPPLVSTAAAALLVSGATAASLRFGRARPYLPVGWLWFLGMLVPVLGFVQVGVQSRADRYTYVPLVGLFVVVVWGAAEAAGIAGLESRGAVAEDPPRRRTARAVLVAAGVATILAWMTVTWKQAKVFKDSISLFEHALRVDDRNTVAHVNLGAAYMDSGRIDEALRHFEAAVRLDPGYADARNNLGAALAAAGRLDQALAQFAEAARLDPDDARPSVNEAVALSRAGRWDEAIARLRELLRRHPDHAEARYRLGMALSFRGSFEEGRREIERARKMGFRSSAADSAPAPREAPIVPSGERSR